MTAYPVLKPLDAFFLGVDRAHICAHVVGQSVRNVGNASHLGQKRSLELAHLRDKGDQRVEIGQRVGSDTGRFYAPVRRQLLDSLRTGNRRAVVFRVVVADKPI